MTRMVDRIVATAYHRNGVCGEPFRVTLFTDPENGLMVAVDFGPEVDKRSGAVCCAVLKVDELAAGNIAFGMGNSWRGDCYSDELRPLVEAHVAKVEADKSK